ncbi:hypothetical protein V1525DRAFT_417912 [Lipomyces kononenkoae]|uniref:Uncharacterized protein n=1 Tax=Lipomyces kononenkoae TaxID=34357 RepID=A0ACC3T674_LIPKO
MPKLSAAKCDGKFPCGRCHKADRSCTYIPVQYAPPTRDKSRACNIEQQHPIFDKVSSDLVFSPKTTTALVFEFCSRVINGVSSLEAAGIPLTIFCLAEGIDLKLCAPFGALKILNRWRKRAKRRELSKGHDKFLWDNELDNIPTLINASSGTSQRNRSRHVVYRELSFVRNLIAISLNRAFSTSPPVFQQPFYSMCERLCTRSYSDYDSQDWSDLPLLYAALSLGFLTVDPGEVGMSVQRSLDQAQTSIQTAFLLAMSLVSAGNLWSASSYMNAAVHACISMGYFWTIVKSDLTLRCLLGIPVLLADTSITQDLLDEGFEISMWSRWAAEPSEIWELNHLGILDVQRELDAWTARLTEKIRSFGAVAGHIEREVLSIQISYLHIEIMLHRPFLVHFEHCSGSSCKFSGLHKFASLCLSCSRRVVLFTSAMKERHLLDGGYWLLTAYLAIDYAKAQSVCDTFNLSEDAMAAQGIMFNFCLWNLKFPLRAIGVHKKINLNIAVELVR